MINNKEIYTMPYEVQNGCLFKWVASGRTSKIILLCNFQPYLKFEKIYDNGIEQERFFEIEAIHETGEILSLITMSVAEFESMNWITEKWGSKCNIEAGRATKEHIRHAIQTTAKSVKPQTIYSHSGWRNINGSLKFLLNGMDFRVSPEEWEEIERLVRLSGMSKQDYIMSRLENKEINITANPRVVKALKNEILGLTQTLGKVNNWDEIEDDLKERLNLISSFINKVNG